VVKDVIKSFVPDAYIDTMENRRLISSLPRGYALIVKKSVVAHIAEN